MNYAHILPDTDTEAQLLLSRCGTFGSTPYDQASIVVDDGRVSLSVRTVYGSNDGTPMDEWHKLVLRYHLPGRVDAGWLRAELSEGGSMAELIDRIIAGHDTRWDGSNMVGRLNADAYEAAELLECMLCDPPCSDLEVWDAEEWLRSGTGLLPELVEELRLGTPEEWLSQAESDGTVAIDGGLEAMTAAFQKIIAEAEGYDD